MPVLALSRVVPVQARLTGRVPIPISAARSAPSCSMPTPDSSWRGAADVEMPLMRAGLRGRPACRDDYESLLALLLEP